MKNSTPSDFPFIKEKKHLYNKFIDREIGFVDLGWSKFIIELHSDLHDGEQKVDGLCDWDEKKIKLEMNLSDMDARETIIHEIYHCMLESVGLDERNFDNQKMILTNEQLVVSLSKQTMTLHHLNPKLFATIYA
tara:strand:+ start:1823 stop:2224 length:402 start_codon:yes stop_codon:yes gene_type:complete